MDVRFTGNLTTVTAGVASVRSHQQAGNLPAEVNSFVGRRQQISEAKRIVCRRRLPTVTGGAGVGKTRGIGRWTIGDLQEAGRLTREYLPSWGISPRRTNFVDSVPVLTTCGYLLMITRHKWGVHHHDDSGEWREAISGPRMRMPGPARPPGPGSWVV